MSLVEYQVIPTWYQPEDPYKDVDLQLAAGTIRIPPGPVLYDAAQMHEQLNALAVIGWRVVGVTEMLIILERMHMPLEAGF